MSLDLTILCSRTRPAWDRYLLARTDTSFGCHPGWADVLGDALGIETSFLMAMESNECVGILPLYWRPGLKGRRLCSLPGGVCAERGDVAETLIDYGLNLGGGMLLLRDCRIPWLGDVEYRPCAYVLALEGDADRAWNNIDQTARNRVRKARRAGLTMERNKAGVRDFYDVFSENQRDRGTPTLPLAFFEMMCEHLRSDVQLFLVRDVDRTVVAGMLALQTGPVLRNVYAASLKAALPRCPNDLLYWEVVRWGYREGLAAFDMGRSQPGSGTVHFKEKFGGRPLPLYSYVVRMMTDARTVTAVEFPAWLPLFSAVWRRLPLRVASALGPRLRRRVPFA